MGKSTSTFESPVSLKLENAQRQHIFALTGLRFFLAFWVVTYHLYGLTRGLPGLADKLAATGYLAVGFFFMLSGFVLAANYERTEPWPTKSGVVFARARMARIYPVYLLGLVVAAPLQLLSSHRLPLAAQIAGGGLSLVLLQSWIPHFALSWNGPGWSLSVEAFFYLLFPFIGYRLLRLTTKPAVLAGGLFWIASLIVPGIVVALHVPALGTAVATMPAPDTDLANFVKFNPILRLPDFCIGILLARAFQQLHGTSLMGRGYRLYAPAILLFGAWLYYADRFPYVLAHNSLLAPLNAAIILGLALGGSPLPQLLAWRPVVFLGGASYSLYILHVPIIGVLSALRARMVPGLSDASLAIAAAVASIAVAGVVFIRFEEPLHRWLRNSGKEPRTAALG
jgi:peptidoglycan/LPS O-acetylase OafA/YrhL